MKKDKILGYIKKILGIAVFFVLLCVCTSYIMQTTKDKGNYLKYGQFYQEKENFDVLFFGSSRILDAVYPMELWKEYGITAYNMAQHSENLNITYWQMKNAFEHNTPKVAVVDLSLLGGGKVTNEDADAKSYLHKSLDHMPLSKIKYDALRDITEGVDIWEYLFPYAMYHNRWTELKHVDFYLGDYPLRKGAESRVKIAPLESVEWSSAEISATIEVEDYKIDEIIALCEENDVEVVFTLMPSVLASAHPVFCSEINAIEGYFLEHGIRMINFAKEDDFLNYSLDFSDDSHLNPSGGKKLTEKMGEYLVENFEFDKKSEATTIAWKDAESKYLGTKFGELKIESEEGDLISYLLLLNGDNDFRFEMRMPNEECIEEYGLELIFEEMNIAPEQIEFSSENDMVEVIVYRNDTGEILHQGKFH